MPTADDLKGEKARIFAWVQTQDPSLGDTGTPEDSGYTDRIADILCKRVMHGLHPFFSHHLLSPSHAQQSLSMA
jgi:hypothetical protein